MRLQAILSHIYKFEWHTRFSGFCNDQQDIKSSTFKVLSFAKYTFYRKCTSQNNNDPINWIGADGNKFICSKVHFCKELYFANEDFYLDLSFERNHCRKFPSFQFEGLDIDYWFTLQSYFSIFPKSLAQNWL